MGAGQAWNKEKMNKRKSKELDKALMDKQGWGFAQDSGIGGRIRSGRAKNRARRALAGEFASESSRSKDQRRWAGRSSPKELIPEKKFARRRGGLNMERPCSGPSGLMAQSPRPAIDRIRKPKARYRSLFRLFGALRGVPADGGARDLRRSRKPGRGGRPAPKKS